MTNNKTNTTNEEIVTNDEGLADLTRKHERMDESLSHEITQEYKPVSRPTDDSDNTSNND